MRILVADDDPKISGLLQSILESGGHTAVLVENGAKALEILQKDDPPPIVICDWVMPELNGIDLCRKIREHRNLKHIHIILLTIKDSIMDIVKGLQAGANDYIVKPFNPAEILARVGVGVQVVELHTELAARVKELETALTQVKRLKKLLPICSYCKKIRDDHNYWQELDVYVRNHSDTDFSHGICPTCYEDIVKPHLQEWRDRKSRMDV